MTKRILTFTLVVCFSSSLYAQVVGDGITVYNTLIDAQTGGAEFFTGDANATVVDPGLEFDDYLGLFDVDFSSNSALMTLVGNSALDGVPLLFPGAPNPRFDTYYYFFDNHDITNVSLVPDSGELLANATVGITPSGVLDFANQSFTNNNNGFFVQFGPGTDYSTFSPDNMLATVSISFEAQTVPEPETLGLWMLAGFAFSGMNYARGRKRETKG